MFPTLSKRANEASSSLLWGTSASSASTDHSDLPDAQQARTSRSLWYPLYLKAQREKRANVVCMKWGTRYGPEFVNRLYSMVRRNTTWNIRFVCFTDDTNGINPEIECQPLPKFDYDPRLGVHWPKLGLFHKTLGDLEGMTLFLDLDVVIIGNIDPFFEFEGRFCMIREWKDPHLGFGNSSVVKFFVGLENAVLDRFHATPTDVIIQVYASKEQNFLTRAVDEVTFWPEAWCPAFSRVCLPKTRVLRFFTRPTPPANGRILIFYGSFTPQSALRGECDLAKRPGRRSLPRLIQRRFLPATWIADYWTA